MAGVSVAEFEELYRATASDLFGYARRRTRGDVEDLVAEVYATAWRRRDELPPALLRRAWLFGVARTLLLADARRRAAEAAAIVEASGIPVGTAGSMDKAEAVIKAALERLSAGDREVLQLVEWERVTPAELAVALGIRPGTARVRLHRARQALARDPEVRNLLEAPRPSVPVIGNERARA